jgi:putative oxidoreductase
MRYAELPARVVLGGYLAAHGAQKLFGAFGGHGLEATAAGFEAIGLTPGKEMALLAGASELGGGLLTATGIADPLGPITIAGAMTVASAVHRKGGPLASNGGYEMALTNLALASVLAGLAGGGTRRGLRLPKPVLAIASIGAATLTAVSLSKLLRHRPASAAPQAETTEPEVSAVDAPEPNGAGQPVGQ